jgi:hypothetical protein
MNPYTVPPVAANTTSNLNVMTQRKIYKLAYGALAWLRGKAEADQIAASISGEVNHSGLNWYISIVIEQKGVEQ